MSKQPKKPISDDAAEAAAHRLTILKGELNRLVTQKNEALAGVNARFDSPILEQQAAIKSLEKQLEAWAKANRPRILPDEKRSVNRWGWRIGWQKLKPRVVIVIPPGGTEKPKLEEVVENLRKDFRNHWCLDFEVTLDREAILKFRGDKARMDDLLSYGVAVVGDKEGFYLEPENHTPTPPARARGEVSDLYDDSDTAA